jgi:hypothetical protein
VLAAIVGRDGQHGRDIASPARDGPQTGERHLRDHRRSGAVLRRQRRPGARVAHLQLSLRPFGCNYNGNASVTPLPTTSVTLPNGAVLGIGVYVGFVLTYGAVLAVAAVAYAERPRLGWRLVLWAMALLLALSLICFRLPPAAGLTSEMGPCFTSSCPTTVSPYPSALPSVWYMLPSAVLGLLAAALSLLPSQPSSLPTLPPDQR